MLFSSAKLNFILPRHRLYMEDRGGDRTHSAGDAAPCPLPLGLAPRPHEGERRKPLSCPFSTSFIAIFLDWWSATVIQKHIERSLHNCVSFRGACWPENRGPTKVLLNCLSRLSAALGISTRFHSSTVKVTSTEVHFRPRLPSKRGLHAPPVLRNRGSRLNPGWKGKYISANSASLCHPAEETV
jgi:hypothetical protein